MIRNDGFTLIEILVVIALLSILAAGLLTLINPFGQFAKANYAKMMSDFKAIATNMEVYYNDNSVYPEDVGSDIPPSLPKPFIPQYMSQWPKGPCDKWIYDWENWESGGDVTIRITVRDTNDDFEVAYYYCIYATTDCQTEWQGYGEDVNTVTNKILNC